MRTGLLIAFGAALLGAVLALGAMRPGSGLNWTQEQALLPAIQFDGDQVRIGNFRNFSYTARDRFEPRYEERSFDLGRLASAWFVLTPFSQRWRGPAHSFVSFGFSDGQFLAISVEARREQGEPYSILWGLLNQFELIYVIGDERDLIGQRAAFADTPVYLYPIRAPREKIREALVQMLQRAEHLADRPEFYNTLSNSCTSNLIEHVNAVAPKPIPGGLKTILPGYADEVALQLGLIDTELGMEQARSHYQINDRAARYLRDQAFSARIREPSDRRGP